MPLSSPSWIDIYQKLGTNMDSVECTALLDITYQITYGLNQQSPCKRTVPEEMDKRSINRRFKQDHDKIMTQQLLIN